MIRCQTTAPRAGVTRGCVSRPMYRAALRNIGSKSYIQQGGIHVCFRDHPSEVGKTELAQRVHKLAGLIGGHGVGTRVSKVMAGEGAGDLHLYVYFDTMSQAMAVGEAMTTDAGVKALMAEREANPAGGSSGQGFRIISGETKGETRASLQRVYEMAQQSSGRYEMLDELRVMMKDEPVNIFAGVPVIASKMDAVCQLCLCRFSGTWRGRRWRRHFAGISGNRRVQVKLAGWKRITVAID